MESEAVLRALIERTGKDQMQIAMDWHTAWSALGLKQVSYNTVESRLSGLLRGKRDGVQFFFGDLERSRVLMDVLAAPEADRTALRVWAQRVLADENAAARLVIDLTMFSGRHDTELLAAVASTFLADPRLRPVHVIVTETQYTSIPLHWRDRAEVEQVVDPAAGKARALALGQRGVCATPYRVSPVVRWLAIEWDGKALIFEPRDALVQLAEGGLLRPWALPEITLDDLGLVPAAEAPKLPSSVVALRRHMEALALGTATGAADVRLRAARELGVVGFASREEWIAANAAKLGLPLPERLSAADFARRLERAVQRPTPPSLFRVDEAWHALNLEVPELLRPYIAAHTVHAGPTALARLKAHVADRSPHDWEEDPRMEAALRQVDPAGAEQKAFKLARLWLLQPGLLPAATLTAVDDGIERLKRVLAARPPAAEVNLSLVPVEGQEAALYSGPLEVLRDDILQQTAGRSRRLWWRRGEPMWRVDLDAVPDSELKSKPSTSTPAGFWTAEALLPGEDSLDEDAWCDTLDQLVHTNPVQWWLGTRTEGPVFRTRAAQIPGIDWHRADQLLVMAWSALRNVLARVAPEQCHTGEWLLPMGNGLMAELTFGARSGVEVRAGLAVIGTPVDPQSRYTSAPWAVSLSDLVAPVHTHSATTESAGVVQIGISLPRRVTVLGPGFACEVTFLADPYGLDGSAEGPAHRRHVSAAALAAVGAAVSAEVDAQEEEETQRRRNDY